MQPEPRPGLHVRWGKAWLNRHAIDVYDWYVWLHAVTVHYAHIHAHTNGAWPRATSCTACANTGPHRRFLFQRVSEFLHVSLIILAEYLKVSQTNSQLLKWEIWGPDEIFFFFFTSFTACTHNIALPFPRRLAAVQFPNMVMEEREKKPERKKLISKEPFLLFPDTRYATGHQSNADNNITRQPCQDIYWRCLSCSPPRDGSK